MGLETATYIADLVSTNPVGASDNVSQGDDHIRLIKACLLATFPNFTGAAVTKTEAQLNATVTAASLGLQFKAKTADESVVASATLQDDDELAGYTLDAGAFYAYEGLLYVSSTAAADFKCQMTFTNAAQENLTAIQAGGAATPGMYITSTTVNISWGSGNGGMMIKGFCQANASTGGTVTLQWAQQAASGTTTIFEGSYLMLFKMN